MKIDPPGRDHIWPNLIWPTSYNRIWPERIWPEFVFWCFGHVWSIVFLHLVGFAICGSLHLLPAVFAGVPVHSIPEATTAQHVLWRGSGQSSRQRLRVLRSGREGLHHHPHPRHGHRGPKPVRRRGFTRQQESPKKCTFEGPGASDTTKIQRKDFQREKKRAKFGAGEKKRAKCWAVWRRRGLTEARETVAAGCRLWIIP